MQTIQKLPKRHEVLPQYTWDLESVYPDETLWEGDFQAVKDSIPRLESLRGTLGQSPDRLLACLRLRDETHKLADQLLVYARMRKDQDNGNSSYQALADRATALASQLSSGSAFIAPEILSIPEDVLQGFLQAEPGLRLYGHQLDELLRLRAHVRSIEVEVILAQSVEIARTPDSTYGMLTNADMKFPTVLDEEGRPIELTQGRYNQLRESRDRRVRRDAFEAIHSSYRSYRNTLAAALSGSVRGDIFYAGARGYGNALEAALGPSNIPTEVYHNLIQTVDRNLPQLHRYLALRRRLLGIDDLHHYDLYVPMVPEVQMVVPYQEGIQTVLAALSPLGPDYLEPLQTGIASRWIDVYENEGKTSGAHSTGSYTTHPFVLLNYQGTLTDVFTLAHELGHSMHSHFSRRAQPYVYGDYTIFVAEVASTLNEALLTDHLLQRATEPRLRAYLINQQLERFRTTLFRQAMFAEFELAIHTRVEAGESLTPDMLSSLYQELNARYYGSQVVDHHEIAMEWARIPHFYWAFYVYQYATGISAAAALARQIIAEGKPAVDRYLRFLQGGSSDYPIELLKVAGVDMTSPHPVQQALDAFDVLLDEMDATTARDSSQVGRVP